MIPNQILSSKPPRKGGKQSKIKTMKPVVAIILPNDVQNNLVTSDLLTGLPGGYRLRNKRQTSPRGAWGLVRLSTPANSVVLLCTKDRTSRITLNNNGESVPFKYSAACGFQGDEI